MSIRRNLIWLGGAPLIVTGLLVILVLNPEGDEHLALGYLFGTIFGQATLAAAWTSFGPLPFLWRLPLSLLWLLALAVALAFNITLHGGPSDVSLVVAACVTGQFLLLQLPFWGLVLLGGMKLHPPPAQSSPLSEQPAVLSNPRELQFGIRQLMIFTAIIAVVLGVGRLIVFQFLKFANLGGEGPIFVFLAAAAIVVTLPLLLAALLPRHAMVAVGAVLVLAGLLTASEVPLLKSFHSGPGPDSLHIIFINAFTVAWVLAVVLFIRLSGYRWGPRATVGWDMKQAESAKV